MRLRAPPLLPFDLSGWSLPAGLRAGLACSVPLIAAELLHLPFLSWTAIVAFWTCLVDPGGPWRTRIGALGGFTLCALAGSFTSVLVRPNLWLSVLVALLWCFVAILARVWGSAPGSVGNLASIVVLVVLGLSGQSGLDGAVELTWLTAIGAAWAMLLTLVLWRQHPYATARTALTAVMRAVGAYAGSLADLKAAKESDWDRIMRERLSVCRTAIEAARAALLQSRRARAGQSARGQHMELMLADADQAFTNLIALDELVEARAPEAEQSSATIQAALHAVAQQLRQLADALAGTGRPVPEAPDAAGSSLGQNDVAAVLYRINHWVAAATEHRTASVGDGSIPDTLDSDPAPRLWEQIRTIFSPDSLSLRHAARFAVTAALVVFVTSAWHIDRGYWISITAVAILQPYPSATWQRMLERVAGSILGGLVAAAAALVLRSPTDVMLFVVPLTVLTLAVRGVSYALFVLCLTPQFVLITELFQSGGALSPDLAGLRALDSVIGGVIGLAASFLLWPSWEAPQLRRRLADAIRANRDYFVAAMAGGDIATTRRQAGLASNNAEASLQRLLSEPRWRPSPGGRSRAEAAVTIVAAVRRLAGVAAAISSLDRSSAPSSAEQWIASTLEKIAKAIGDGHDPAPVSPPALEPDREGTLALELTRARRQVMIVAEAAGRLTR